MDSPYYFEFKTHIHDIIKRKHLQFCFAKVAEEGEGKAK